jgi:K+-sensing histidine kinase KdpD
MEGFPFPVCEENAFPPSDGFIVKCPTFFRTLSAKPFVRFFKSLPEEETLHIDPVGFTVLPLTLGGRRRMVCGVRVEGFYDRKKTKAKIGADFNPVLPLAVFVDTVAKFRSVAVAPQAELHQAAEQIESKEFVSFTMHEIRKLNLQIKSQAEEMNSSLTRGQPDAKFLEYRAQNIFATSALISMRLDAYDFHINPAVFATATRNPIAVYKKFEKTKHCLQIASQKQHKNIKLEGASFHSILGYTVFELLPFVLLENAIKYSPGEQDISVTFGEMNNRLEVTVESLGPMLLPEEESQVFHRRFRGTHAKDLTEGTGVGLHFAKLVCDLHNINISVQSDHREMLRLNGISYSMFRVRLQF